MNSTMPFSIMVALSLEQSAVRGARSLLPADGDIAPGGRIPISTMAVCPACHPRAQPALSLSISHAATARVAGRQVPAHAMATRRTSGQRRDTRRTFEELKR